MDPSTIAVIAGRAADGPGAPISVPPMFTSTYVADGPTTYGRDDNPTWAAFETAVGALEGGTAVSFSSGMAAIAAVFGLVGVGGAVVVPSTGYNGTRKLLALEELAGRINGRLVDVTDSDAVIAASSGAQLVFVESPTNPLMEVCDLAAVCGGVRGPLVCVDNTFATPLLQRPLDLGADLVVHSATKLLSGHSDVVIGVVVARDEHLVEQLRTHRTLHGSIPGPMEAFLALRGLRTLAVRVERAQTTAANLAGRLAAHRCVEVVRYPGSGTMLSFDVAGGAAAADAVCGAVRVAINATSLGGVETLLERRNKYVGEEATPPGLIRLSAGLEHPDDLWADLDQALGQIT